MECDDRAGEGPPGSPGWVVEQVDLPRGPIAIERPADYEELLVEEAFEREELLPYWGHLWSSAVLLAEVVEREARAGARVLELGCGLGLVAIAAARAGALVTATDWSPPAVETVRANAARNGVSLEAFAAPWEAPERLVGGAPWDLVVAADVLYERPKVEALLGLLPRLGGEVLLADPRRAPAEPFFDRASERWTDTVVASRERPRVDVHRLRAR